MSLRNRWVSEPNTPERLAEAMARSLFAVIVYHVVLIGVFVWAGATTDWFAAVGMVVPLFWFVEWIFPDRDCRC